ncbi:MAG: 4Fe-4S binding protein [Candidatus Ratteibacteria bacterium]|nr:4Fe-4S binding protein [Candidatus Ratteibacteria bacterium]
MKTVKIKEERCKGCQICINFCPKGVLKASQKLNKKGFHTVEVAHEEKCSGCGICFLVCPDTAIEIYESPKE